MEVCIQRSVKKKLRIKRFVSCLKASQMEEARLFSLLFILVKSWVQFLGGGNANQCGDNVGSRGGPVVWSMQGRQLSVDNYASGSETDFSSIRWPLRLMGAELGCASVFLCRRLRF